MNRLDTFINETIRFMKRLRDGAGKTVPTVRKSAKRKVRQTLLFRSVQGTVTQPEKAAEHRGTVDPEHECHSEKEPHHTPAVQPSGKDHHQPAAARGGRLRFPPLHPPLPYQKRQHLQLLLRLWLPAAARRQGTHR